MSYREIKRGVRILNDIQIYVIDGVNNNDSNNSGSLNANINHHHRNTNKEPENMYNNNAHMNSHDNFNDNREMNEPNNTSMEERFSHNSNIANEHDKAHHFKHYHRVHHQAHHIQSHVINNNRHYRQQQQQQKYLESCNVIVFPALNPDHEAIQIDGDESLSSTLDIQTNINKDGMDMLGVDTIENYVLVLKALVYSNKKPAYYLNRVFKVTCSPQLKSPFDTGEFTLTLTVLHPKQTSSSSSVGSMKNALPHGYTQYLSTTSPEMVESYNSANANNTCKFE